MKQCRILFGRPRTDAWMDSGRTVPMANIATESFVLEPSQISVFAGSKATSRGCQEGNIFGQDYFSQPLVAGKVRGNSR